MQNGTVKWFRPRGFGVIKEDATGTEYFVHYTGINTENGEFATLYSGEKVSFDIKTIHVENRDEERETAVNVTVLEESPRRNERRQQSQAEA